MKLSGKVVDSNGEPLALANITLITGNKAGKIGTISGVDGDFFLDATTYSSVITPNSEFAISYMGYVTQNFKASDLVDNKKVVLLENIEQLNEVTVINSRPKVVSIAKKTSTIKENFFQHLSNHKYVYASIGGLAGLLLIFTSIKKL